MNTNIKWNAEFSGVEIKTDDTHIVVSAQPTMVMSWDDAVRFYKGNKVWQLPTREHLQLIAARIDEINALIKANGGYEIFGWHWTADEYNEFFAWLVEVDYGGTANVNKNTNANVRAVSAFQN